MKSKVESSPESHKSSGNGFDKTGLAFYLDELADNKTKIFESLINSKQLLIGQ